jgi:hypothetical protein
MSASKSIFHSLLDAMVDARTRQAERIVAYYQSSIDLSRSNARKR